jgi:hypothetical protein
MELIAQMNRQPFANHLCCVEFRAAIGKHLGREQWRRFRQTAADGGGQDVEIIPLARGNRDDLDEFMALRHRIDSCEQLFLRMHRIDLVEQRDTGHAG